MAYTPNYISQARQYPANRTHSEQLELYHCSEGPIGNFICHQKLIFLKYENHVQLANLDFPLSPEPPFPHPPCPEPKSPNLFFFCYF